MLDISKDKLNKELIFGQDLLILVLFYFGIAAIFDYFINVKILGLSFFVTIITYGFVFFIFIKNLKIINRNQILSYFIIVLLLLFVLGCRALFYQENMINMLGNDRFIFFVPVVLMLFNRVNFKRISEKKIRFFLLAILVIHSINSLFYLVGIPAIEHVDVLADDYVEFSRFGGIMGGSNVQAVFTSTIYTILVLSDLKMSVVKFFFLTLLSIIAIAPTISRGGMVVLLLTLICFFYNKLKKGSLIDKISISFFTLFIVTLAITQIDFSNIEILYTSFFDRFDQDDISSGRGERLIYFWKIINNSIVCYIIGVPVSLQETSTNAISDNVFTLLPVNLGVIFTILFLTFIFFISKKVRIRNKAVINWYLVILFLISFTNNAIIWTAWTYYVIFGFFYLKFKSSISDSDSSYSLI
ncbi:hypothetical protein CFS9_09380 [Flavobacterium sp. CFS9]|uniref:O-Antigen ligase n=1 Tax=Flavobacterium sp. CFS9 TaxID=3143118 RepID=A0AAT9GXP6_9FLAO